MKLSTEDKRQADMMVKYGRRDEQLLGRIMLCGMESLSDAEQVEFYLYYYQIKKDLDARALAERMVEKFGDMANLALLSAKELMQVEGMYPALARRFTNFGELLKSYVRYERHYKPIHIRNIIEMCRHVLPLYRASAFPATWQLCLNADYELIYQREIAPSIGWGEEAYIEEGLFDAEYSSAASVIVVQMRGTQFADPKPYDKKHAKLYAERLEKIGCRLLDVVMVDEGKLVSMYELGMIRPDGKKVADRQVYFDENKYDADLKKNIAKYIAKMPW